MKEKAKYKEKEIEENAKNERNKKSKKSKLFILNKINFKIAKERCLKKMNSQRELKTWEKKLMKYKQSSNYINTSSPK